MIDVDHRLYLCFVSEGDCDESVEHPHVRSCVDFQLYRPGSSKYGHRTVRWVKLRRVKGCMGRRRFLSPVCGSHGIGGDSDTYYGDRSCVAMPTKRLKKNYSQGLVIAKQLYCGRKFTHLDTLVSLNTNTTPEYINSNFH